MAGGGRDGDEGAFPARTALLLYKSAEAAPPGRKTTCVRRRRALRKARVPIRSALPAPRKGIAHCPAAVGRRKRGLRPFPNPGRGGRLRSPGLPSRAPRIPVLPAVTRNAICIVNHPPPPPPPGFGKCGLNGATSRSKLSILEHSRRQAPQEEPSDENGGCLYPLSAPFLGCAGNKTPIIHWMASNSCWGRPALQLTPPDPYPSVRGFPTPRRFSRWGPKARSRRVECSAAKT